MQIRNRSPRQFLFRQLGAAWRILVPVALASCASNPRDVGELVIPDQFHVYYQTSEGDIDNRRIPGRGFDQDGSSVSVGLSWNLTRPPRPARGLPREDLLWLLQELRAEQAAAQAAAQAASAPVPQEEPPPIQEPPPAEIAPAVVAEVEEAAPPEIEASETVEVAVVPDPVVEDPPPPIEEPPVAEPIVVEPPPTIDLESFEVPTPPSAATVVSGTENPWLWPVLVVSAAGLATLLAVKLAPRATVLVARLSRTFPRKRS